MKKIKTYTTTFVLCTTKDHAIEPSKSKRTHRMRIDSPSLRSLTENRQKLLEKIAAGGFKEI